MDRFTYARLSFGKPSDMADEDYDHLFRQQAALDAGIATNTSLLAASVLDQHPVSLVNGG